MGYLVSDVIFERQTHIDPRLEEVTLTHKKWRGRTGPNNFSVFWTMCNSTSTSMRDHGESVNLKFILYEVDCDIEKDLKVCNHDVTCDDLMELVYSEERKY